MTIERSRNTTRINVWRNRDAAICAKNAFAASKRFLRATIYPHIKDARDNEEANCNADAVHFDGNVWGQIAAMAGADTEFLSWAFWFKYTVLPSGGVYPIIWRVDAEGDYPSGPNECGLWTDGGVEGIYTSFVQNYPGNQGTGSDDRIDAYVGEWHFYTGTAHAGNYSFSYLDGVLNTFVIHGDVGTFPLSGLPFWIGSNNIDPFVGDLSQLWISRQQLYDGSGGDTAMLAKFTASGGPVDLGENGELPTGTPPDIYCNGDSVDFRNNRGTGGEIVWTGALTNASTSPSD